MKVIAVFIMLVWAQSGPDERPKPLDIGESKKLLRETERSAFEFLKSFERNHVSVRPQWLDLPTSPLSDRSCTFKGKYKFSDTDNDNVVLVLDVKANWGALYEDAPSTVKGEMNEREKKKAAQSDRNFREHVAKKSHEWYLTLPKGYRPPDKMRWVTATAIVDRITVKAGSPPTMRFYTRLVKSDDLNLTAIGKIVPSPPATPILCFMVTIEKNEVAISNCGDSQVTIESVSIDDAYETFDEFKPAVIEKNTRIKIPLISFQNFPKDDYFEKNYIPRFVTVLTNNDELRVDLVNDDPLPEKN